ncbi:STAS domain-containing protein [Geomonas sp. RF6]|uniref:STAS domain-containing protein n=1 Tax=Geomonas sp. RF6 TaxID=2897342 RepID=UPI001E3B7A47|nr:STAS domain-containing protein [Geomonas sp. RF6]UFS72558.1 STAS domain-containing protein [Geomonas sp. RF6]
MDRYSATVAVPPEGTEATITVTGAMTVEHATQIRDDLLHALSSAQGVVLDLSAVEELDIIGLQLICALHRTVTADGKLLEVKGLENGAVSAARIVAGFAEKARCANDLNGSCVWSRREEA